jgi:RNA polymerase sigma-70 factor, ECF subfamily
VDEADFDRFYAASAPRLVGQLTAMTGNFSEAQDCVQEAFVKAWLHRRELDAEGNPEAWVRRTAWHLSISRWRSATAVLRALRRRGTDPDVPAPADDHSELVAALRRISPDQRRAIVLHHLCDLSIEEIARETGAPEGTVKAWLSRGRRQLAAILAADGMPASDDASGKGNRV